MRRIGAPEESFHIDGLEFYDKLSFLKGGIVYASHGRLPIVGVDQIRSPVLVQKASGQSHPEPSPYGLPGRS